MMKSNVINNYIDNKIRTAIYDKKTIGDILSILQDRIETTKNSDKMRTRFRDHMIFFAEKRINDILFLSKKFEQTTNYKTTNETVPTQKLLNMIRLRDKLCNKTYEFEI